MSKLQSKSSKVSDNTLQFVASITVCPSDIRKIQSHLLKSHVTIDPLQKTLITPLFVERGSLALARKMMEENDREVVFDSGGYYVQMGRIKYEQLYLPLLKEYRNNPWASLYTLPDYVPLSQDSAETVDAKVRDTISRSCMFFHELPDELKAKAMPVVHGRTHRHLDACLEAYSKLGVNWIGFGSFGTQGSKSEINVATDSAVDLARYVIRFAHAHDMKVHLFGLGVPALVAMIKGVQADSFDSSSWLKAAGFGQIFLPFMRAYNISHRSTISELQRGITFEQFESWKVLTGHKCAMCEDLHQLQTHKMHRAVHNLVVISETVAMANEGKYSLIESIYHAGSPRYRREYSKWLQLD